MSSEISGRGRAAMRTRTRRIFRIAGGGTLVALGTVMLVLPGPGLLTIVAGLALLAEDFPWARAALDRLKRAGKTAVDAVRRKI